jgi:hypothetical protein
MMYANAPIGPVGPPKGPGLSRRGRPRPALRSFRGASPRAGPGLLIGGRPRPKGPIGASERGRHSNCGSARQSPNAGAATPLTLLLGMAVIFFPVTMLVLSVPTWEQRLVDAQDAARAAARALATANSVQDAETLANQAVAAVMEADGLPAGQFQATYSGELVPGALVRAAVSVQVPISQVPGLGAVGDVHYTATATAHVDSYEDSTTGGALGL